MSTSEKTNRFYTGEFKVARSRGRPRNEVKEDAQMEATGSVPVSPHTGRRNTFDVQEMLTLRLDGWTLAALGRKYNVDHTTIIYHCQKHSIHPIMPLLHAPRKAPVPKEDLWENRLSPDQIAQAAAFRENGYTFKAIAYYFDVHWTAIIWHCKKLAVVMEHSLRRYESIPRGSQITDVAEVFLNRDGKPREGKTYRQYLEADRERKRARGPVPMHPWIAKNYMHIPHDSNRRVDAIIEDDDQQTNRNRSVSAGIAPRTPKT
jgi:hypothetical protein